MDKVEFVSWKAHFDGFWGTYKGWIIGTLIGVVVLLLLTAAYYFFDWDLESDTLKTILPILLLANIGAIIVFLNSCWVGFCIILLGMIISVGLMIIEYKILENSF